MYAKQSSPDPDPSKTMNKIELISACTVDTCYDELKGWTGPKPLFMAGIYSGWKSGGGEVDPVYSYSVLTRYYTGRKNQNHPFFFVTNLIRFSFLLVPRESNAVFGWLHHRVPVILADEAAVSTWLDPEMDSFEALDKIPEVSKDQVNLF